MRMVSDNNVSAGIYLAYEVRKRLRLYTMIGRKGYDDVPLALGHRMSHESCLTQGLLPTEHANGLSLARDIG